MATSIGSAAAFTSGNMKPLAGEQIDAIWGQNIADNTACLRAVGIPVYLTPRGEAASDVWFRTGSATTDFSTDLIPKGYFKRPITHNRLVGTVRFDGTWTNAGVPDCVGTFGVYLWGDLGTYGGTTTLATANIGANFSVGSAFTFELDLASYMSVGSWGTVAGYFSGSSNDHAGLSPSVIGTFGFMKAYTTWAN
jgi:hypothetical protein